MTALTVGSMFTGIGGIDLGLERAGMRVIWQAEIDPYASRVLTKHWPDVPNMGDVTTIEWGNVERPDLICGGYPCQPFSKAGEREGENDPRHLWPRMHDAIRHLRPRWVLLENVAAHLSLGFGQVLADLASIGYDTEWDCVPAASVGAPHQRDRVFVVAYPDVPDSESTRLACPGRQQLLWPKPSRSSWWTTEPDVGRVVDGFPGRVDRLRTLGNAVVPQVAEHVGRLIVAADQPSESTLHNPNNT